MTVVWSPLALERVAEIAEFIARDRPQAAADWVEGIFASVERLGRYPHSGRSVAEVPRWDVREVIQGRYRVLYRVESKRLLVLTVRHAREHLRPDDPDLM